SPTSCPSPTSRSTSATAWTPPNLTEIPLAFSTGVTGDRLVRSRSPVPPALRDGVSPLAPDIPGGAPVLRAEEAAEMLRPGKAPATRDRENRLAAVGGIDQVAAAALQPRGADPAAHGRPLGLEQLVEIARRDEHCSCDLLGAECRIAEMRLDVRLDAEQDLCV